MSPPDAQQVPPYVYWTRRRPHVYEALPPPLKWDASFWFYDGDVTLVVQGLAFRLHTTMLANWSEVFESWFIGPCATIPHPHDLGSFDGWPLVALRAVDTAHDLREALLLMYGIMRIESVTKYSVAAALHRVALAYRMPTIVDAVHKLLDHAFPATIHEWDNRPADRVSFDLGKAQAIEAYNIRESLWEEFTESVELPEPVGGPFEDREGAEVGDGLRAVPGARENSALGNP
ncbi:hypothetical protein BN946_scf185027.g2 [Trametes cinnabarina]|uniref:BTB domain-containing protein n=1 Tax=Pycnoporus cinnabarinus TaxID=5643 RepID=A0A060SV90_PYCCI|nr:hypothetical protein BN946_scf185027.g2 [Trametes cinnabarina]